MGCKGGMRPAAHALLAGLGMIGSACAVPIGGGLYDISVTADGRSSALAGWSIGTTLSLSDQGVVSYGVCRSMGFGSSSTAIYVADGSSITLVASGNTTNGRVVSSPQINNNGQVVYHQNLAGTPTVQLWDNGSTSTLYGPNNFVLEPQGGLSDNLRWAQFIGGGTNRALTIRGPGGAVVASGLLPQTPSQRGSISRDGNSAVMSWLGPLGSRIGFSALSASGAIRDFDLGSTNDILSVSTAINNHGIAAVVAEPRVGATARSFVAAIDTRAASPNLVTLADSQDGVFGRFGTSPGGVSINNLNEVAYVAGTLAGSRDHLFVSDAGGRVPLQLLGAGDIVTSDGASFASMAGWGIGAHSMNDKGQIAFLAHLMIGNQSFDAILRADPLPGVSPANPILPGPGDLIPSGGWRVQPGRFCRDQLLRPLRPGQACFIDPEIAIGYDYAVEPGGPNFASVYIPAPLPNGDDVFGLEFEGLLFELHAGDYFDFTSIIAGGVSHFRITGIDTSEALDPADPLAFITGLSFTEGGRDDFTMTMRPLTDTDEPNPGPVPEPASLALVVLGVAVLSAGRGRRRKAVPPMLMN